MANEMEPIEEPMLDLGDADHHSIQSTTVHIVDNLKELLAKSTFNCETCNAFFKSAVFAVTGKGVVCKDCLATKKWSGERLTFYDTMLKNVPVVPCPNASAGCKIEMLHESIESHVDDCKYRLVNCVSPGCPWQSIQDDLVKHFEEAHQEHVIDEETVLNLDLTQELFGLVKLLISKNKMKYFLFVKLDQEKVSYRILNMTSDEKPHGAAIKHYRGGSDVFIVLQMDTQELNVIDKERVDKQVSLLGLKTILEGRNELSITVDVALLTRVEEMLLCSGCGRIMRPPIYQCEGQHDICRSCFSRRGKCSVCQKELDESCRHESLENLTSDVLYSCKSLSDGCTARMCLDKLIPHESTCHGTYGYAGSW